MADRSWIALLGWSAVTIAATWVVGHVLAALARRQAQRLASTGRSRWLQAAADAMRRPLPWWCLVVGAWLAAGYWPLTPQARLLVDQAAFLLIVGSMTLVAAGLGSRVVDRYSAALAHALPATSLTKNIVWAATVIGGGLVMLNGLGLSITPMLAALGVGGLAVALALQEPLANFFAGVFVTLARQIRVGDYVRLDSGQEGYIVDFSWRSTRLRMLANNLIVVPNARLAQAIVVNHHLPSEDLAVLVEVGVEYSSDLRHVERVVTDVGCRVMNETAGGVKDFEPFIRYHTFAESSVNFTVVLRAREFVDQYLIKHEFIKLLHDRFREEGIVIPFPIRTILRRDENPGGDRAGDRMAGAA
jgi:small-conductance mechanosensitive channel